MNGVQESSAGFGRIRRNSPDSNRLQLTSTDEKDSSEELPAGRPNETGTAQSPRTHWKYDRAVLLMLGWLHSAAKRPMSSGASGVRGKFAGTLACGPSDLLGGVPRRRQSLKGLRGRETSAARLQRPAQASQEFELSKWKSRKRRCQPCLRSETEIFRTSDHQNYPVDLID